ncbi:hypothetical protein K8R62_03135 [bacterium]|nr:hypothetical protein [bacterium]
MKKLRKISEIILLIVLVSFFVLFVYSYWEARHNNYIKYQDKWYTLEEFDDLISQGRTVIEAKNTPEEAYKNFLEAIRGDDIDRALDYISEDKRIEYYKVLSSRLEYYKSVPEVENIHQNLKMTYENSISYYYQTSDGEYVKTVSFKKGLDGYWRIDYI